MPAAQQRTITTMRAAKRDAGWNHRVRWRRRGRRTRNANEVLLRRQRHNDERSGRQVYGRQTTTVTIVVGYGALSRFIATRVSLQTDHLPYKTLTGLETLRPPLGIQAIRRGRRSSQTTPTRRRRRQAVSPALKHPMTIWGKLTGRKPTV